jgi:hypothetical protein
MYVCLYVCICVCMYICTMYVCMYACMYVCMYVCVYVRMYLWFFIIYLQHTPLHAVIIHDCRKLCHIYVYSIYIYADLFTVYALIVRLQFSVVDGVCKIGKLS